MSAERAECWVLLGGDLCLEPVELGLHFPCYHEGNKAANIHPLPGGALHSLNLHSDPGGRYFYIPERTVLARGGTGT